MPPYTQSRIEHAGWCLLLAEQAEAGLNRPAACRDRLEAELENLCAAMTGFRGEGRNAGAALRLVGALWQF